MTDLFIFTSQYPFAPGEEFFEEEAKLWGESIAFDVYLVPLKKTKNLRPYPKSLTLDLSFAQKNTKLRVIAYVISAILSKEFWIDISYLREEKKLDSRNVVRLLKSTASLCLLYSLLKKLIRTTTPNAVIYTYWNNEISYAAAKLKKQKKISKVITRLHRYDIYEEIYPGEYIPLKRQFLEHYDHIMLISEEAKNYVELRYGANSFQTSIERLGVEIPLAACSPSPKNYFHVISVSFCVPVKRIDKIVHALAAFAQSRPHLQVKWIHIGNGPLLKKVQDLAKKQLNGKVDFEFLGYKKNSEIKRIYQKQPFDVFINCSHSEGVPVSIMEAMSFGVPTIAPNVGGIKELLGGTGYLMSSDPDVSELKNALIKIEKYCKYYEKRMRVRAHISSIYNAHINYTALIKRISKTSSTDQGQ
jgi:glycosyltransferase involved in cell wall biosynthesis